MKGGFIMKIFKQGIVDKINEISDKYRLMNHMEIEQHQIYDFCVDFNRMVDIGVNADQEDIDFINKLLDLI